MRISNGMRPGLILLAGLWSLPEAAAQDVRRIYQEYCASCHGQNLQGGLGGSLVDGSWRHGADDDNVARVIRDGVVENGMPGFGDMLSEAQTRALVVYIREMAAQAAERQTSYNRPTPAAVVRSDVHAYRLETVAEGLEIPWSLAFLPDGRLLVTERDGRLRVIEHGRLQRAPVAGTPAVWAQGQGGLLAVAPHPDYEANGWIYLAYSDPGPGGTAMTAIVRGRIRDGRWTDQEDVFRAPHALYRRGGVHFGCRLVFQDGYLFFTIGDRGAQNEA
ncbi:MAG TPA: PQQ-dependent sugar dehydrogenase, partial [Opitutaceae bacterium]|nr:PQQ-dependent sugar dehydrogenase [Opitutaceae bacterium]